MSRTILVLEDDRLINEVVCELLGDEGYEPAAVATLSEARAHLAVSTPACMLLDLDLPDGTAEEFLFEVALRGTIPPCVLVSASTDAPRVAAAFGLILVRKPFDLTALIVAMHRTLRRGSLRRRPRSFALDIFRSRSHGAKASSRGTPCDPTCPRHLDPLSPSARRGHVPRQSSLDAMRPWV